MDEKDFAEPLQETILEEPSKVPEGDDDSTPEKMIPASKVNELVKQAKWKGEKKMQDQLDAANQQIQQLQSQQPQQQAPALSEEQVMQLLERKQQESEAQRQEAEKKRQAEQLEQEVNQVAQQYFGKMAQGKDLFEDFEAVTADFNPAEFPQLVFLASQLDNTPALIYELRKNPGKLADLAVLVERSPSMARTELTKLSESIKRNDEAKRIVQEAQDPLSRLKPSPAGTDSGVKSVGDYRKASFLKV